MNEEEAIEQLKIIKTNIDKKYINTRNSKSIETVLNLIEKQQAEIEEYRKIGLRNVKEYNSMKKSLKGIINKQNIELKKKDKIIGLIVDRFQQICVTPSLAKYQWKRICSKDLKICEGRLCEDCIKEYFERKIK